MNARRDDRTPRPEEHGLKSTYDYLKCRCPQCRAANAAWTRQHRRLNGLPASHMAGSRAVLLAAKWVRQNHPAIWSQLLDEAYVALGESRRPPGRQA